MVPFANRLLTACLILAISREAFSYLAPPNACRLKIGLGSIRFLSVPKSQSKFLITTAEASKLYSSVINPSEPSPLKPGPFRFIKRMVLLTILIVKLNSLKVLSGVTSALGAFQNVITKASSSGKKNDRNKSTKKINNKFLFVLSELVKLPKFWIQLSLLCVSVAVTKYLAFTKSLTTELSYTSFLKLITAAPERVAGLRVTPSAFMFRLDGKSALTRMVTLEPVVMSKLLSSGIDFAALPAPTNVFGLIWTFAYAAFIWNISTKMMQGPQDEGAGKRKDKAGDLDAYGKLSFEDVAGQERAKLEVKEVCEMLQAPEKYLTVGARLPSGVLLVGPPGTGEEHRIEY